jgi:hypothetical protein
MKSNALHLKTLLVAALLPAVSANLSALDYYWVNGSGNWSAFSTHWAKIPNPTLPAHYHANVPTADDDVYFGDTNGGAAYTVNVDAGSTVPKCRNMDWTGVPAGTVWGGGGGQIDIYGSATLDAGMSMTYFGQVHLISNDASTKVITSNGVHFSCAVYFEGTTSGWQLADEFYCALDVNHSGGLLETMGEKVTIDSYFTGNYGAIRNGILHLGNSEVNIRGSFLVRYTPSQFNSGTSHIKMLNANQFLSGYDYLGYVLHFYDVSFLSDCDSGGFAWGSVDGTLTFHGRGRIHGYSDVNVQVLNNVVFLQNAHIYNAVSYNSLTLTAGKTYTVENYCCTNGTDQTILPGGTLTALGAGTCSQFITIKSWQYGTAVKFINNSGADIMTGCVILEDVHADGTNTLTVNDGVNLGNTTGWIFINPNPGLDLYWVGGAGDWNDPCHWTDDPLSLTGDCGCLPNGASNVHFTANSGFSPGDKVTVSADAYCADMDWTGVTGEPEFFHDFDNAVNLHIYGSVTLSAGMNFNFAGVTRFRTGSVSTIKSAGNAFQYTLVFEGTGTWELQDSFKQINYSIYHERGVFKTLGHPMVICQWLGNWLEDGSGTRVNMGAEMFLGVAGGNSSNIHLEKSPRTGQKGELRCFYEAGKFHAVESHIIGEKGGYIDCYSTTYHDFWDVTFLPIEHAGDFLYGNILNKLTFLAFGNLIGPNSYIHEVEFHKGSYLYDNHTFDILTIYGGYRHKLQPWSGTGSTVQTITAGGVFNHINSNCEHPTVMFNPTPGETATFRKEGAGTAFDIQHTIFDRVYADQTSGAIYTATNCVAVQPDVEASWNIANPAPRDLYWVGGAGDWNDPNHWSLTSGGAGGECPPTPHDDVFFNAAAGLGAGDAVTISEIHSFCKDMDWTGVGNGAVFDNTRTFSTDDPHALNNLNIFGNLTFSSSMVNNFISPVWLRAKGPATITSAGQQFKNILWFWEPDGDWTLGDALFVDKWVDHSYGILRSNNHAITVGYNWYGAPTQNASAELHLGSSTMTILSTDSDHGYSIASFNYGAGKTYMGTSSIVFEDYFRGILTSRTDYPTEFYNVTFKAADSKIYWGQVNNKLVFEKSGTITEGYPIRELDLKDDVNFIIDWTVVPRDVHSIRFAPGKRYTFSPQYRLNVVPHNGVEGQFIAQGLPGQYIEMKSSDPNTPAIIHKDDYDGTSTCTKYLFLTGMTHTGTEDIYVPTPGGDVFNNAGWLFFPCNPCPATIPVLDVANSITTGCPPGTAKLVLAGLKPDEWANWYTDPAATTDLVYSGGTPGPAGNMFQPAITGPVTYYARVYSDGGLCESTVVLAVEITITSPPAAFNVTGGGLVCAGSNGTPVGLDGSATGVSYQLQLDGSDLGSPLAGTGSALDFGLQTAAGTYTVVANTDGTSCPATMTGSAIVTGSQNQAPVVVATSNSPLCTPADLYLTEYGGAAVTWNWTGPGGFASSDQNPVLANASPANSGTYTVVVSDGLGCTNIGSVGVAVSDPYPAYCPTDTSLCIDFGLFDLSWGGWPPGGTFSGPGVSQNQFDPAVAGPGAHVLSYSVYDANNCPVSCTFTYTVFDLPAMTCPGDSTICLGFSTPFVLTGGSPAGGTYSGPGVTAGEFDAAAAGIGQHLITYTAYAYGCANTCTFTYTVVGDQTPTLTVNPPAATLYASCDQGPPPPDAAALDYLGNPLNYSLSEVSSPGACSQELVLVRTYSVVDPNAICNTSTQFVQTIYVEDNQAPVLIGLADITVSSTDPLPSPTVSAQDNCDPSPSLSFSDNIVPGVCPVSQVIERTWTTSDECDNAFTGLERITVVAQAAISGDLSICAGQGTTLTASGGVSYAWSPGGENTPSIMVSPAGTTTYTVTATDAGGCTATASATVALTAGIAFSVAPTSPSCNGATDGSLLVTNPSGGQPPYQYALDNNPLQNSPLFSGLGVGAYTITVQDADGCTAEQQASLPQGPDQPLAIQCPGNVPALTANSSCQATLGDYTGLATLSGGCGIPLNPIVQMPAPGTVVNPGTVAITLTVSNTAGQSAACVFNVTVSGGCGH